MSGPHPEAGRARGTRLEGRQVWLVSATIFLIALGVRLIYLHQLAATPLFDEFKLIADVRYYGDDPAACRASIERIAERGCRFLVFNRNMGTGLVRLSDLDLPEPLRRICKEIPADQFREDISSTEIRKSGDWGENSASE